MKNRGLSLRSCVNKQMVEICILAIPEFQDLNQNFVSTFDAKLKTVQQESVQNWEYLI